MTISNDLIFKIAPLVPFVISFPVASLYFFLVSLEKMPWTVVNESESVAWTGVENSNHWSERKDQKKLPKDCESKTGHHT